MIDAWQLDGNTTSLPDPLRVVGTTSWRRTSESLSGNSANVLNCHSQSLSDVLHKLGGVLSKAWRNLPEYWHWRGQVESMWQFLDGQVLPVQVKMEDALDEYHANLRNE